MLDCPPADSPFAAFGHRINGGDVRSTGATAAAAGSPGGAPVVPVPADAEGIRRELLSHEASIRSAGSVFFLVALLYALAIAEATLPLGTSHPSNFEFHSLPIGLALLLANAGVGWGLRRLQGWAVIGASLLACVALLSVPFGTLFGLYVLYILHTAKGRRVMTPRYRAIVDATPHVVYYTNWAIIIAVSAVAFFAIMVLTLTFA